MSDEFLMYSLKAYEKKLKEYMSEEEYAKFAEGVARKGFYKEIKGMVQSDFKKFCLDNFDKITQ